MIRTAPTLPSVRAADSFLRHEPGSVGAVLFSMLERAAIIGPTLYLAGERKNLVRYTLATTVAIELVVLFTINRQLTGFAYSGSNA